MKADKDTGRNERGFSLVEAMAMLVFLLGILWVGIALYLHEPGTEPGYQPPPPAPDEVIKPRTKPGDAGDPATDTKDDPRPALEGVDPGKNAGDSLLPPPESVDP